MQIGMIGLGRMGANMVRRLLRGGHTAVVFDPDQAAVQKLVAEGATGAASLDEFVAKLESPKTAWCMVPAGEITEQTVRELGAASARATPSSTAATPTSRTTSAARRSWPPRASPTSTSAPAAACGGSSAATA